jgi:hypothetical protein
VNPLIVPGPGTIVVASIIVLVLLWIAGYGWARAWIGAGTTGVALAPAFGVVVTTIAGIVLDRLGFRLDGSIAPVVAFASACACGYLAALVLERRVRADPAPKIHEQPHE